MPHSFSHCVNFINPSILSQVFFRVLRKLVCTWQLGFEGAGLGVPMEEEKGVEELIDYYFYTSNSIQAFKAPLVVVRTCLVGS